MSISPLNLTNSVILDTEITGLDSRARIVEISLIDGESGTTLFSSLVNPLVAIPEQATAIHGITDADVIEAPTFDCVWNEIKEYLWESDIYIYNTDYDYRLIRQSLSDFGYPLSNLVPFFYGAVCVMHWYAEFYGEWNHSCNAPKWQSLSNACGQQGVDVSDLKAHRALADCEMTRRLINAVNSKLIEG